MYPVKKDFPDQMSLDIDNSLSDPCANNWPRLLKLFAKHPSKKFFSSRFLNLSARLPRHPPFSIFRLICIKIIFRFHDILDVLPELMLMLMLLDVDES